MKLTFHGGVGQVTGANYLLESGQTKILIDCGMNQGSSAYEKKNWQPFVYDPKTINAVLITHSHIDHIGLLPKLYRDGFRGDIFSTPPCRDFAELLLYDSQHILIQESEHHKKPLLYKEKDIGETMKLWQGVEYYKPVVVGDFKVTFYNAGHILGSSFILVEAEGKKIVFSGDLGNSPAPIIGDKDLLPEADYCLIESTYGDRVHEDLSERQNIIEDMIEDAAEKRGVLMIPAFAMERSQQLLFEINNLMSEGRAPKMPVFLDSPLAIKLTDVYRRYRKYFSKEVVAGVDPRKPLIDFSQLKKTLTTDESKAINDVSSPKVIIAGSGMMHAGRILHHLKRNLSDPDSILLIVGYQAEGSLGRRIYDGAAEVKIHGEKILVKARVKAIGGYSAHADQPQLLAWLKPRREILKKVFIIQGEEGPSGVLRDKIRDELAIDAEIPKAEKSYVL